MDVIRLHDLQFKPYISAETILRRIKEMAAQMNQELKHEQPVFIGVLNGVFMFAAEMMKELTMDCEITFVKLNSYNGTSSSGQVATNIGLNGSIAGRNVVILEDIVDTGKTIVELLQQLKEHKPDTIRLATLLFKPDALEHDVEINYCGFKVPNEFLVGFGLDYDGLGRNLKDIYVKC
jgi:hypoxanthine phosphoribosyltransferase